MSPNPREHDLDELRKVARERGAQTRPAREADTGSGDQADAESGDQADAGFGDQTDTGFGDPEGARGVTDRSSFRAGLYRELLPLEGTATAEKPYLQGLPDTYAGEHLVFEWIEHLLSGGYREAAEALDYYESIGWITPAVRSDLGEYLRGVDDPTGTDENLDADDHMRSLVYVAELASVE